MMWFPYACIADTAIAGKRMLQEALIWVGIWVVKLLLTQPYQQTPSFSAMETEFLRHGMPPSVRLFCGQLDCDLPCPESHFRLEWGQEREVVQMTNLSHFKMRIYT